MRKKTIMESYKGKKKIASFAEICRLCQLLQLQIKGIVPTLTHYLSVGRICTRIWEKNPLSRARVSLL